VTEEDDTSEEYESDEDEEGEEEGEEDEEDDEEEEGEEEEGDRRRDGKRQKTSEASSCASSSTTAVVSPPVEMVAHLQEISAITRGRVERWQAEDNSGMPQSTSTRITNYVEGLAKGESSTAIVSAFTGLCDVLLDQLERQRNEPPRWQLTEAQHAAVCELRENTQTFADATISDMDGAVDLTKQVLARLEKALTSGTRALTANTRVLQRYWSEIPQRDRVREAEPAP
jgi:hypothetical protein